MNIFDNDFESAGAAVPRSAAEIALMVRRLGVMESAYARLIWSHALAEAIEDMDRNKRIDELAQSASTASARLRDARIGYRTTDMARLFQIHMGLRSPSATLLLFWLVGKPNTFFSSDELGESLGLSGNSIKVFVSELRKSFRNKGMRDPIFSSYRRGYCVPLDSAAMIRDLVAQIALEDESRSGARKELFG